MTPPYWHGIQAFVRAVLSRAGDLVKSVRSILYLVLFLAAVIDTRSVDNAALADPVAPADPLVLVMLGDSITAGFGLPAEDALPSRLQAALADMGYPIEIRNAGVSGDTTAGGRERIDWSVSGDVDAVLIALGGNDVMRAIPPEETGRNLDAMITDLKARGLQVLLAGMLAPPNYGPEFAREFEAIYQDAANRHEVPLYPFLLDGVVADPALNQPDGIHPNRDGVDVMVERMTPFLIEALFDKNLEGPYSSELN